MLITRTLTSPDLYALTALFDEYRQFYGQNTNIEAAGRFLTERFKNEDSYLIGAFQDEVLAGFTQLYPSFSSVAMVPKLILNDMYVLESARRSGVAEALLNAANDLALENGVVSMVLATRLENSSARSLYEKFGWTEEKEFTYYNYEPRNGDA